MKRLTSVLTLCALTLSLVMPFPAYANDARAPVTIRQVMTQGTDFDPATGRGTNRGTWIASGAFADAGAASETFKLRFGCSSGICSVKSRSTLTSSANPANTVTIKVDLGGFTPISETQIRFEGKWHVVSGTGVYEGLSARGRAEVIVDLALADQGRPSNFGTFTGLARLDDHDDDEDGDDQDDDD